jgi:hypothetical protein
MQLMIAFGTEIEPALHNRLTLRTAALQWLPQYEIQNDTETVSNHNSNHRPQHPVHTSPPGVAIDVDDQQEIAAEYDSREKTKKTPDRGGRGISLNRH